MMRGVNRLGKLARLGRLERHARDLALCCPRCGVETLLVPTEDGAGALRLPAGQDDGGAAAYDAATAVAEAAFIAAMRGERVTAGDVELSAAGPPAPGWEQPPALEGPDHGPHAREWPR